MISTLRGGLLAATLMMCGSALAGTNLEATPAAVQFSYSKEAFRPWSFDTGWLPETGEVQVRFYGDLGGGLRASAPGRVHLGMYPQQMWLEGDPMSGWLSMNMGVELHALMRLNLALPTGGRFTWEGEIPAVPNFDYRFAGTSAFTPFLLDGQPEGGVQVSDTIQQTELFSVPLTSAIIPLPGIGGYLDVYAGGLLDVLMRGSRVAFPDGDITTANGSVPWLMPIGSTFQCTARYEANVDYSPALLLQPTVSIHVGPAEWDLAQFDIPVALPTLSEPWIFNEQTLTFGLPGGGGDAPDA